MWMNCLYLEIWDIEDKLVEGNCVKSFTMNKVSKIYYFLCKKYDTIYTFYVIMYLCRYLELEIITWMDL